MILHDLFMTTSTNTKQQILRNFATDEDCMMFEYAYNKDKVYGVKFTDEEIDFNSVEPFTNKTRLLLDQLRTRELTGNEARRKVKQHANRYGDLIKLICNKDLQCGVTATTVNKVFPGTIPVFKVQLAKEAPLDKQTYPLLAQLKYDGVRITITYDGHEVLFRTRNGKIIHLPFLNRYLKNQLKYPIMLDTEVTLRDGTTEDRTTVSGMINSARSKGKVDESKLVFHVFDAMFYEDFAALKCREIYLDRFNRVKETTRYLDDQFRCADTRRVDTPQEAMDLFHEFLSQGQEGLILKPPKHYYTFKRSKDWIKMKEIKSEELKCLSTVEGTGKYQGMIGALECIGKVEGKTIKVKVGSGLTDHDRSLPKSHYIGMPIEIKYNSVIKDSVTGEWSLFLPRFVEVRHDKSA